MNKYKYRISGNPDSICYKYVVHYKKRWGFIWWKLDVYQTISEAKEAIEVLKTEPLYL